LARSLFYITESLRLSKRMQDNIASFGERFSARIVAANLNRLGVNAKPYDSYDIGFVTDDNFTEAEILPETYLNLRKGFIFHDHIPVVTGFIAKNLSGNLTTLGRGGSDYSASILGAALDAVEIQIWTDVTGVKTADPRIVPEARTIEMMSFSEASELAYFGAKVLHPKTILPAVAKNIPVRVLNTYEPENPGTLIVREWKNITPGKVRAISCKKNIKTISMTSSRMLNAFGFLERLFSVFARNNVVVDVISTSEVSVSATVERNTDTDILRFELEKYADVTVEDEKAIICVIGDGLKSRSTEVASGIFHCLAESGIYRVEMISQGASEINITFVVDLKVADNIVKKLHEQFFGDVSTLKMEECACH
ncbi:MAG: aspartate kinase, partial [Candidatus Wallbacteria bacterium]|nr:aspartate kinase [Candidatus Wallbacteria bacterium]